MEVLVCCVFAYWFVKHIPEIAGDAAQAFAAGLRGEESPAAAARRARLQNAGIDPASGGAFRQYAGNLWRDFWLDQDQSRARRRAASPDAGPRPGVFGRIRDAFDTEVDRRAQQWRHRSADAARRDRADDPTRTGPSRGAADPFIAAPDEPPPPEGQPGPSEPDGPDDPETPESADDVKPPRPGPQPAEGPVRVGSALGEQPAPSRTATAVLELEGTPDMSQAVDRGTAVTGVISGAAEARSIQRALESATEAYDAAVANARRRIHSLGEQTLGVVQMAGRSTVVGATAQAAEAIAAAQAGVNTCKAEVIPLLGQVAREFDRRNS